MRCKSPIDIYISKLDATAEHTITSEESRREEVLHNPNSLRRSSYVSINPKLSVHTVYRKTAIAEFKCKVFTRLRVGSHRLRIAMGWWSRVPRDERLYPCGSVQDEKHTLLDSPLLDTVRAKYTDITFDTPTHLMDTDNLISLCTFCDDVLRKAETR